ncbi:MAG: 16S rRNA (guanine(527)-N(7))-methyltransferase RsmG [Bacteroidota bacterium]
MEVILKYFPKLNPLQIQQFGAMESVYKEWNSKINLVSRKDIDELYERHILHSLSIAKLIQFADHSRIVDVGSGGGFPGLPLAVIFPEVNFLLIDSIGKKINTVKEIASALELHNLKAVQARAEDFKGNFDFVTARAVATLGQFYTWTKHLVQPGSKQTLANGILYLKGGEVEAEIKVLKKPCDVYEISDVFDEAYFETKKIVHIPIR